MIRDSGFLFWATLYISVRIGILFTFNVNFMTYKPIYFDRLQQTQSILCVNGV